ncbi:TonB-dependent siderophore receptor [Chitinophaga nivalis]|uniref:TonB-dependent siderophore receptor n=1 Tax=Chitinophaga nivalis TaxID=2991709 RepID=A0ABT3IN18_9BACT|nr:TonB-dependent siderophore receptor [Chitinophaga nivalis]MCW3464934.1 TonB-dependent siderophore receptor [Chitinophaga nivalis]MCW3485374.1 TonB-dependent siderophore receptor [Chitinophaga nivalis]
MLRKTMSLAALAFACLHVSAQEKETTDSLKVLMLDELTVTSKYYKKYNLNKISSDLRLQSPLIETPQNIQIISAEVLRDQVVTNLIESVARNVSGTMREELHNAVSPDIYSRGGYINAQRNGVDLRPLIKGPLGDDAAMIEAVEFVKGPSGFMTALSDPAGSYNIVTKKPTGKKQHTFKMMHGSFGLFRAESDMGGVLDNKGKWQYRFNLMGMTTNGFMKFDNSNRILIAPAVKYQASEKTSFTLEYIYQQMNYMLLSEAQMSPYGYGTLPRDFSITDPNIRPYRAYDHNIFFTVDHKLNDNWKLTTRISNINNEYNGSIFWVYGKNNNNPDILNRYHVYDGVGYNTFSAQAYVQGRFKTGTVGHAVMAGIDYNDKRNNTTDTWGTATTVYPLSITHPKYGEVTNNNGIGGSFDSENDITGEGNRTNGRLHYVSAYVMDEISLTDKLKVNAGLRMTQSNANFNQYGTKTDASDLVVTPRIGVNYMLQPTTSVYALYDHSYLPQAGVAHDKTPLKPLTGKSYEVGVKKDWHDGTWNTTLSVYQIYRKRTILRDPVSNDIYQTGENKSEGVELDVRGRVAKGLNIVVNYAFTESKITKDEKNPEMVGMATPNRIKHIQNTWLNYALPIAKLPGIAISTGYQYMAGRAERYTSTNPEALKDFFRLDAGISYTRKKYSLNLIVNNILDDHLYSTAWKRNDMYYWVQVAPRNFRCSLTVNL